MAKVIQFRQVTKKRKRAPQLDINTSYNEENALKFESLSDAAYEDYKVKKMYDRKYDTVSCAEDYIAKTMSNKMSYNDIHNIVNSIYEIAYCKGVEAYRKHKSHIDRACGWA